MIEPKFSDARSFSEALAWARLPNSEGGGYIDKRGSFVIQPSPQFQQGYDFSEGLAPVQTQGFGYIDKTGTIVIPVQFSGAEPFSGGLAEVMLGNDLHGYIDKQGHYAWNPSK